MVGRQKTATSDEIEANCKCLPVAQDLFCGGVTEVFRQRIVLEQFIMRRDNVFDSRTIFSFLQPQGVDEDALIRNRRRDTLQLRELAAGQCQCFQDRGSLESPGRKAVEGWNGGHKVPVLMTTCIENANFYTCYSRFV